MPISPLSTIPPFTTHQSQPSEQQQQKQKPNKAPASHTRASSGGGGSGGFSLRKAMVLGFAATGLLGVGGAAAQTSITRRDDDSSESHGADIPARNKPETTRSSRVRRQVAQTTAANKPIPTTNPDRPDSGILTTRQMKDLFTQYEQEFSTSSCPPQPSCPPVVQCPEPSCIKPSPNEEQQKAGDLAQIRDLRNQAFKDGYQGYLRVQHRAAVCPDNTCPQSDVQDNAKRCVMRSAPSDGMSGITKLRQDPSVIGPDQKRDGTECLRRLLDSGYQRSQSYGYITNAVKRMATGSEWDRYMPQDLKDRAKKWLNG